MLIVVRGYDVVALAKKTWAEIGKDKVSVYAAQMAYSFFFALFPLLLFFAALLSLVADKQTVMAQFNEHIAEALPGDVASLLGKTIEKVIFARGAPGLLSFGLLTAAWSGSSIFGALRVALNDAYGVEETRPWWKQYALQLGMLLVAGVVIVLSTVILLNGEGIVSWLAARLGLQQMTAMIWTVLQFPLALAALVGVIWMIYYFLPDCRHQDKRILIMGALLATLFFIAATLLFRVYVQRFNQLNPAYGAIGAIMVLLTWMYYSSFVLLAVGELTAEIQAGSGRVDQPSTSEAKAAESVPRAHALALSRRPSGHDGARREGTWAPLDWITPVRVVRRARVAVSSAGGWMEEAAANIRADIAVARREVARLLRSVGSGTALCAIGGTLALLGALSFLSGVILLVGDQWLPYDWYPLAALMVAILAGLAAWVLARRGLVIITQRR
ncbi:MAG TPA: YhjD/YihY/BrkB family envelope integrity protein [Gemmatimonadaceae bacterium]|nr:YhjD/YihY/BrkB family envelope integrity protein [Gemmatimonadaceae bacterium]